MDTKLVRLISTALQVVIGIIGVILCIMIAGGKESIIDFALKFSYVILGICGVGVILFALYNVATNIKKSIPMLAGIVVFAIILFVGYSMGSEEIPSNLLKPDSTIEVTGQGAKYSGGVLISFYILLGLTVLAVVYSSINKLMIRLRK